MRNWIEITFEIAYLFTLWMLVSRVNVRNSVADMAGRNPDLLASRPDWKKGLNDNHRFLWACNTAGALSIAALVSLKLGLPTPDHIGRIRVNQAFFQFGILFVSAIAYASVQIGWTRHFRSTWRRRLPLAPRRHATLEVRQFGAYVPAWLWALAIGLAAFSVAAAAVFAMRGGTASITIMRWVAFGSLAVVLPALLGTGLWSVRRRPSLLDRHFGRRYRRYEARAFIMSAVVLAALHLVLLGWRLMGRPLGPFYFYDLMLLLLPGMAVAGAIWHRVNARKQAQDHDRQENAS